MLQRYNIVLVYIKLAFLGVMNQQFNMYADHSLLDMKLSSMVDRYQCFREMCKKNGCMAKNCNNIRNKGPGQGYEQTNRKEQS